MAKQKSKKNRRGKLTSGFNRNPIVVIRGQQLIEATYTQGTTTAFLLLIPALITRLSSIADAYNLYRYTRLKFIKCVGNESNAGTASGQLTRQVLGLVLDDIDTGPSTISRASELAYMLIYSPNSQTVPASFSVSRNDLLRKDANKWWKTIAGADSDIWDEVQGNICFADSFAVGGTSTCNFVLEYEIELTDAVPTTSTPQSGDSVGLPYERAISRIMGRDRSRPALTAKCAPVAQFRQNAYRWESGDSEVHPDVLHRV